MILAPVLSANPVGPGAEVIADNNIHIYGPLRGRALCGVSGNASTGQCKRYSYAHDWDDLFATPSATDSGQSLGEPVIRV